MAIHNPLTVNKVQVCQDGETSFERLKGLMRQSNRDEGRWQGSRRSSGRVVVRGYAHGNAVPHGWCDGGKACYPSSGMKADEGDVGHVGGNLDW